MTKAIIDSKLDNVFPEMPEFVPGIRRAPSRGFHLTKAQTAVALKNAGHDVLLISPDGPYGEKLRSLGLRWQPLRPTPSMPGFTRA